MHAQSCPTLCNTMDCSPPGSSIYGNFQARTWEWVAISFSRKQLRNFIYRLETLIKKLFPCWFTKLPFILFFFCFAWRTGQSNQPCIFHSPSNNWKNNHELWIHSINGFNFLTTYLLVEKTWANHLNPLTRSFLTYKMGTTISTHHYKCNVCNV